MLHIFRSFCLQAGQVKLRFGLTYGLLVIVLLLLGGHAHAQPRTLVDVTAQKFLTGLPKITNGSTAWGDYNNDGRQDLLIIGDPNDPNYKNEAGNKDYVLKLYQNTPNGFVDVSELVPKLPQYVTVYKGIRNGAVAWGDYDHDGWLDFMLTGQTNVGFGVTYLFSNSTRTGEGFIRHPDPRYPNDKTFPSNLPPLDFSTVNWVDYDSDGWLDLMITGSEGMNQTGPNPFIKLYHNVKGQNRFDDVTSAQLPDRIPVAYGAVAWGDYDNDKKPDLLLTGHSTSGPVGKLYHNTGSGFEDVTGSQFINLPAVQNGAVAWGDYDHDGKLDLMLMGDTGSGFISKLYHNTGSGFEDATTQLPNLPNLANGTVNWVDFDKDDKLDLMLTGDTGSGFTAKFYYNTGNDYDQGIGFLDDNRLGSLQLKLPQLALSAVAWGDYDNDGYPDLLITGKDEYQGPVSMLLHNQSNTLGETDSTRFRLITPLYNCQSGAFTFQTSGGDGSPIQYMAPGITAWTTNPHQFVDRETRTAADAQPISLVAHQSGKEVYLTWDIRAVCPVDEGTPLRLVAPVYNCQTGAFTFQTMGGDGSPIEYMATGITAWTTNPHQFVDQDLRTAADAKPLLLKVRQHGQEDTYVWDLRAVCPVGVGRCTCPCCVASPAARLGVGAEPGVGLKVQLYPNPLVGEEVTVVLEGVQGESVKLLVVDQQGRAVVNSQVAVEQPRQEEPLRLGSAPGGLYLLRVSTAKESQTLKLIKMP